jgi:putative protein-disulfide isomerase
MSRQPHVLYVADAYCGWCFGFGPRLKEFEAANRHRIGFRVISGGLFVGERARPIGDYPHIPEANARIARLSGVHFGDAYNALLAQGVFRMDSMAAAEGLAALRAQDEARAIEFLHRMQQAFYGEGRSLSDAQTYAQIATEAGVDPESTKKALASGEAARLARSDIAWARELGVSSYPTLLFMAGDQVRPLPATGTALEVLNRDLDAALRSAR